MVLCVVTPRKLKETVDNVMVCDSAVGVMILPKIMAGEHS